MGEKEDTNGLGHVEELDEAYEEVQFTDEDGRTITAAILAIVEVEEAYFAVLAPVEQLDDDDGEELEIYLFQYEEQEDGTSVFSWIEDEAIFDKVQLAASALLEDAGEA